MKSLSIVGSSRNNGDREKDDFYPTPPYVVEELLKRETFEGNIWECACGEGDISKVFIIKGYDVISTDLVYRGYGEQLNFLQNDLVADNIITNPPYKDALEFIVQAKKSQENKLLCFSKQFFLKANQGIICFKIKYIH